MNWRRIAAVAAAAACLFAMAACGEKQEAVAENTVFSVDDLEGKKIGVQTGTTGDIYATDYEGDEAGTVIERYSKGVDAVMALKQGKIDCVIIDNEPAKVFVSQNEELTILDEPFEEEEYAICIDKSNAELKEKINGALAELKADGTLTEIMGHWIGDDADNVSYVPAEGYDTSNGVLTMATNAEFPPYESMDGDNVVGIDADIAHAIAEKLGMSLKIDNMEFDSIIMAVTSGKADIGVAGMTVTEDRLKNVDFTDTYTTAKQVIIVRK